MELADYEKIEQKYAVVAEQLIRKFVEYRLSFLDAKQRYSRTELQTLMFMPVDIPCTACTSTNVQEYGYHAESQALAVRFKGSASAYRYLAVTAEDFAKLEAASSKGQAIHLIKLTHRAVKLGK